MKRVLKWFFGIAGGLILLVIVAGWIALSSDRVSRWVIGWGLRHAPPGLSIASVHGRLRGPLLFTGITYATPTMTVSIDSARVDWRQSHLLRRQLQLDQLQVDGLRIQMADSAPPATVTKVRNRPSLPVDVRFGDVVIRNASIRAPQQARVHFDSVRLTGRAADYHVAASGSASTPHTGDIPLHLTGNGTLERLRLDTARAIVARGTIVARGDVGWWPAINWDATLHADSVQPSTLMPDSTSWPGAVSLRAVTKGTLDSVGPTLSLAVDSLNGTIRKQPLRGKLQLHVGQQVFTIDTLSVGWGSILVDLGGRIADTLQLHYRIAASDLRTVASAARGALTASGTVSGTRTAPRVQADASGSGIAYAANRAAHIALRLDAGLAAGGRIDVDFRADSAVVSNQSVSRLSLGVRGTRQRHHIVLAARTARGNVSLGATGGAPGEVWQGRIDTLTIDSSRAGSWTLDRRAALTVSMPLIRIDTLCLSPIDSLGQRDTSGAYACIAGSKRPTSWQANVRAARLPLTWFAGNAGAGDSVTGTVAAAVGLRANGDRVVGSMHVATSGAALSYRAPGEKKPRAIVVDSAVVDGSIGPAGVRVTLGARVVDDCKVELATVAAKAALPGVTGFGTAGSRSHIDASIHGRAANLGFLEPFVASVDSIAGSLQLDAIASGTVASPHIDGSVELQRLVASLPGQRRVSGAMALHAAVFPRGGRDARDQITIAPQDLRYSYHDLGRDHWLAVNGAGIAFRTDAAGAHASVDMQVKSDAGSRVAVLRGKADLPEYAGTLPLKQQPVTVGVTVDVADLGVLQLVTAQVDSLGGHLALKVDMHGRLDVPTLTAHTTIDSLRALLPFGTFVRGGLAGDMQFSTDAGGAMTGSMKIAPTMLAFDYRENNVVQRVTLDSTAITASVGSSGVHGALDVTFADSGRALGGLHGTLAMPQYTHVAQPVRAQTISAALTGRIADLSFIKAFTPLIDSAAGTLAVDSKVAGTVGDARMTGALEVHRTAVRLPRLGILVDSIELTAKGDQRGVVVVNGTMQSGGGRMTIAGTSPFSPSAAAPGKMHIEGTRFEAAHSAQLRAIVSPKIDVTVTDQVMQVRGEVDVPLARLVLADIPPSAIAPSDDIVFIDSTATVAAGPAIDTDIRIALGDSVSFSGFNFNAKLSGALHVVQRPNQLATGSGEIVIDSGSYKAYGQDLTISQGKIDFVGGPIDNPGLDIRAARTADSVTAGLDIKGTLKSPEVAIFSDPAMSQTEALSYIVTGHGIGQGSAASGSLLSKALGALGLRGGNAIAGAIGHDLNLDQARIETAGDIKKASFVAGAYLSPNVYVSYGIGLFDPVSTLRLRYVISNHFTLQAETGKSTGVDVLFKSSP